jgi:hypothetical protein
LYYNILQKFVIIVFSMMLNYCNALFYETGKYLFMGMFYLLIFFVIYIEEILTHVEPLKQVILPAPPSDYFLIFVIF